MKTEEVVVMSDSPEAATFRTDISGWVSRDGRFFGDDERLARWAGATHAPCSGCGAMTSKHYTVCDSCRCKRDIAQYDAMPKKEWDGTTPLYSQADDKYFFGDVEEYCEDEDRTIEDLRLVICEPVYGRPIESDYFCDELPEDGEVPDVIAVAMDALNTAIKEAGPLSWVPGKYAAIVTLAPTDPRT